MYSYFSNSLLVKLNTRSFLPRLDCQGYLGVLRRGPYPRICQAFSALSTPSHPLHLISSSSYLPASTCTVDLVWCCRRQSATLRHRQQLELPPNHRISPSHSTHSTYNHRLSHLMFSEPFPVPDLTSVLFQILILSTVWFFPQSRLGATQCTEVKFQALDLLEPSSFSRSPQLPNPPFLNHRMMLMFNSSPRFSLYSVFLSVMCPCSGVAYFNRDWITLRVRFLRWYHLLFGSWL